MPKPKYDSLQQGQKNALLKVMTTVPESTELEELLEPLIKQITTDPLQQNKDSEQIQFAADLCVKELNKIDGLALAEKTLALEYEPFSVLMQSLNKESKDTDQLTRSIQRQRAETYKQIQTAIGESDPKGLVHQALMEAIAEKQATMLVDDLEKRIGAINGNAGMSPTEKILRCNDLINTIGSLVDKNQTELTERLETLENNLALQANKQIIALSKSTQPGFEELSMLRDLKYQFIDATPAKDIDKVISKILSKWTEIQIKSLSRLATEQGVLGEDKLEGILKEYRQAEDFLKKKINEYRPPHESVILLMSDFHKKTESDLNKLNERINKGIANARTTQDALKVIDIQNQMLAAGINKGSGMIMAGLSSDNDAMVNRGINQEVSLWMNCVRVCTKQIENNDPEYEKTMEVQAGLYEILLEEVKLLSDKRPTAINDAMLEALTEHIKEIIAKYQDASSQDSEKVLRLLRHFEAVLENKHLGESNSVSRPLKTGASEDPYLNCEIKLRHLTNRLLLPTIIAEESITINKLQNLTRIDDLTPIEAADNLLVTARGLLTEREIRKKNFPPLYGEHNIEDLKIDDPVERRNVTSAMELNQLSEKALATVNDYFTAFIKEISEELSYKMPDDTKPLSQIAEAISLKRMMGREVELSFINDLMQSIRGQFDKILASAEKPSYETVYKILAFLENVQKSDILNQENCDALMNEFISKITINKNNLVLMKHLDQYRKDTNEPVGLAFTLGKYMITGKTPEPVESALSFQQLDQYREKMENKAESVSLKVEDLISLEALIPPMQSVTELHKYSGRKSNATTKNKTDDELTKIFLLQKIKVNPEMTALEIINLLPKAEESTDFDKIMLLKGTDIAQEVFEKMARYYADNKDIHEAMKYCKALDKADELITDILSKDTSGNEYTEDFCIAIKTQLKTKEQFDKINQFLTLNKVIEPRSIETLFTTLLSIIPKLKPKDQESSAQALINLLEQYPQQKIAVIEMILTTPTLSSANLLNDSLLDDYANTISVPAYQLEKMHLDLPAAQDLLSLQIDLLLKRDIPGKEIALQKRIPYISLNTDRYKFLEQFLESLTADQPEVITWVIAQLGSKYLDPDYSPKELIAKLATLANGLLDQGKAQEALSIIHATLLALPEKYRNDGDNYAIMKPLRDAWKPFRLVNKGNLSFAVRSGSHMEVYQKRAEQIRNNIKLQPAFQKEIEATRTLLSGSSTMVSSSALSKKSNLSSPDPQSRERSGSSGSDRLSSSSFESLSSQDMSDHEVSTVFDYITERVAEANQVFSNPTTPLTHLETEVRFIRSLIPHEASSSTSFLRSGFSGRGGSLANYGLPEKLKPDEESQLNNMLNTLDHCIQLEKAARSINAFVGYLGEKSKSGKSDSRTNRVINFIGLLDEITKLSEKPNDSESIKKFKDFLEAWKAANIDLKLSDESMWGAFKSIAKDAKSMAKPPEHVKFQQAMNAEALIALAQELSKPESVGEKNSFKDLIHDLNAEKFDRPFSFEQAHIKKLNDLLVNSLEKLGAKSNLDQSRK